MQELKLKYNELIHRINKAQEYFKECSKEDLDKYLPLFLNLFSEANKILKQLQKKGLKIHNFEREWGFNVEN